MGRRDAEGVGNREERSGAGREEEMIGDDVTDMMGNEGGVGEKCRGEGEGGQQIGGKKKPAQAYSRHRTYAEERKDRKVKGAEGEVPVVKGSPVIVAVDME